MTNKDIFARLGQRADTPQTEQREPEIVRRGPQPIIPPTHLKATPIEKLLCWLVNFWGRPTITLRDIYSYGPYCTRDPADITNLTKTLVDCGWLAPVEAWRRDMKKWRIVREPSNRTPTPV